MRFAQVYGLSRGQENTWKHIRTSLSIGLKGMQRHHRISASDHLHARPTLISLKNCSLIYPTGGMYAGTLTTLWDRPTFGDRQLRYAQSFLGVLGLDERHNLA